MRVSYCNEEKKGAEGSVSAGVLMENAAKHRSFGGGKKSNCHQEGDEDG